MDCQCSSLSLAGLASGQSWIPRPCFRLELCSGGLGCGRLTASCMERGVNLLAVNLLCHESILDLPGLSELSSR